MQMLPAVEVTPTAVVEIESERLRQSADTSTDLEILTYI